MKRRLPPRGIPTCVPPRIEVRSARKHLRAAQWRCVSRGAQVRRTGNAGVSRANSCASRRGQSRVDDRQRSARSRHFCVQEVSMSALRERDNEGGHQHDTARASWEQLCRHGRATRRKGRASDMTSSTANDVPHPHVRRGNADGNALVGDLRGWRRVATVCQHQAHRTGRAWQHHHHGRLGFSEHGKQLPANHRYLS